MNITKKIIGSGLSGPLLAILLSQRGYNIDLYEKRSDIRKNNCSIGKSINLALSHRGIKALKSANIFDQIKPHLIPMKGRMIHLLNGELDYQPYSIHSNEYINSVSRSELNKILISKAEESSNIEIHFEHDLLEVNEINNELIFNNGIKIQSESHVLGADGVGSVIRKYIDNKSFTPSYTKPLGHGYKELHIPPANDDKFQLDPYALHIWPREGFMMIALPNIDKSFTCTLFLSNEGEISFKSLKDDASVIKFFNKYFKDIVPMLDNFPKLFFNNPLGKLSTVYAKDWQYGNQYCLIGDAAHAIVPFFGQGMNASFEDCEVLINCMIESKFNWDKLFYKYNNLRLADGHAIANMALENYIEMRDLVTKKEFIKQRKISNILWKKYPKQFIPRYNMVSFTSIPYAEVYKRGKIQSDIIKAISSKKLNYDLAEKIIMEKLTPIN